MGSRVGCEFSCMENLRGTDWWSTHTGFAEGIKLQSLPHQQETMSSWIDNYHTNNYSYLGAQEEQKNL